jgi:hypothetical protein
MFEAWKERIRACERQGVVNEDACKGLAQKLRMMQKRIKCIEVYGAHDLEFQNYSPQKAEWDCYHYFSGLADTYLFVCRRCHHSYTTADPLTEAEREAIQRLAKPRPANRKG